MKALAQPRHMVAGIEGQRRRACVRRQQAAQHHGQRFLASEQVQVGAGPARLPGFEPAQQVAQRSLQLRIADDRPGELDVLAASGSSQHRAVEMNHAPAPRATTEGPTVVHLAGVAGQQVAGLGVDLAAAAGRALCALLEHADAVGVMPVPAEMAFALGAYAVHARPGRAGHPALVPGRRQAGAALGTGCGGRCAWGLST